MAMPWTDAGGALQQIIQGGSHRGPVHPNLSFQVVDELRQDFSPGPRLFKEIPVLKDVLGFLILPLSHSPERGNDLGDTFLYPEERGPLLAG